MVTTPYPARKLTPHQRGFTLVELMVGVVLGMLTVIVIAQVLAEAEGRRRNVAMGGDAEINGSLSLFTLQRDLQMAGYGLSANPTALGCPIQSSFDGTALPTMTIAPVVITNGALNAPDSITVMRAQTTSSAVPIAVAASGSVSGRFKVVSALGIRTGDQYVSIPANPSALNPCNLFTATNDASSEDTSISSTSVPHATTDKWNTSATPPDQQFLINVGVLARRTYLVTTAAPYTLRVLSRAPANGLESAEDLYPEIVNLQALYGKDTTVFGSPSDGTVDAYNTTAPANSDEWGKVLSVKVALVARSNHYEKEEVTKAEPLWDVGASVPVTGETLVDCGSSKCITLKIDYLPDWKHYRYKVYSTTIPLRNVLWNS